MCVLQRCEGMRPDVQHLDQSMMTYEWFKKKQVPSSPLASQLSYPCWCALASCVLLLRRPAAPSSCVSTPGIHVAGRVCNKHWRVITRSNKSFTVEGRERREERRERGEGTEGTPPSHTLRHATSSTSNFQTRSTIRTRKKATP